MLTSTFSLLVLLLYLGLLVMSIFALAHAALQRPDAYSAADKQTKQFWLIILGISVAIQFINLFMFSLMLLVLVGVIASIVYIVDVRPAVEAVSRGRGSSGGSSSDGPYGPYNGGR